MASDMDLSRLRASEKKMGVPNVSLHLQGLFTRMFWFQH